MSDLLVFSFIFVCHEFFRYHKYKEAYWSERRGRNRVEQEMRRITKHQLNTDKGFFVQPVGILHSCYRQCVGKYYYHYNDYYNNQSLYSHIQIHIHTYIHSLL